ncbi:MAG: hypothetical protein SPE20_01170 [Helicobacter sp.]|uniref:hypothetical protein n=1 Tax=Campylobacterales TaxID=213849 RepID=UPI000A34F5D4|nr:MULTISPECIES: hypothetical protein [Campylobacterales]MCL9823421.1 hypothetical protein [Helicobacter colisuis]MDY4425964.1 hypothetical protein [Helicobacter sp.]
MSNNIEEIANTEENKKLVAAVIYEFHDVCNSKRVVIPNEYRKECIDEIVAFYEKYLKTHKQKLISIDYYKIISWYAVFVAEKMFHFYSQKNLDNNNWIKVIMFAVWRMLEELEETEQRSINKAYMSKIIAMVACEIKKQSDFGIGKNGLYMLMLIARIVQIP